MNKSFYRAGVILGLIFDIYLLIVVMMMLTKNESLTAFAFISGLIPLIGGVGCMIWFITFITRLIAKEVSVWDYKIPVVLTSIAVLIFISVFVLRGSIYG